MKGIVREAVMGGAAFKMAARFVKRQRADTPRRTHTQGMSPPQHYESADFRAAPRIVFSCDSNLKNPIQRAVGWFVNDRNVRYAEVTTTLGPASPAVLPPPHTNGFTVPETLVGPVPCQNERGETAVKHASHEEHGAYQVPSQGDSPERHALSAKDENTSLLPSVLNSPPEPSEILEEWGGSVKTQNVHQTGSSVQDISQDALKGKGTDDEGESEIFIYESEGQDAQSPLAVYELLGFATRSFGYQSNRSERISKLEATTQGAIHNNETNHEITQWIQGKQPYDVSETAPQSDRGSDSKYGWRRWIIPMSVCALGAFVITSRRLMNMRSPPSALRLDV